MRCINCNWVIPGSYTKCWHCGVENSSSSSKQITLGTDYNKLTITIIKVIKSNYVIFKFEGISGFRFGTTIDSNTKSSLTDELDDVIKENFKTVMFDLAGVTAMTSSSYHFFIEETRRLNNLGKQIFFICVPWFIEETFEMIGLWSLFKKFDDLRDACDLLSYEQGNVASTLRKLENALRPCISKHSYQKDDRTIYYFGSERNLTITFDTEETDIIPKVKRYSFKEFFENSEVCEDITAWDMEILIRCLIADYKHNDILELFKEFMSWDYRKRRDYLIDNNIRFISFYSGEAYWETEK